jgi:Flp pilus assembly protein CpaB
MQRGGQLLIVLGLILAVITAGLVYTATRVPETTAKIVTVDVVVAVQDISERVEIQAPMLAIRQWPADAVPVGIVTKMADAVGKASWWTPSSPARSPFSFHRAWWPSQFRPAR